MAFFKNLMSEIQKVGDELDKAKPGLNDLAKNIGVAVKNAEPTLNKIAEEAKDAVNSLGKKAEELDKSEGGKKFNAAANVAGVKLAALFEGPKETTPERHNPPQDGATDKQLNE